jgi:hypothetical protein
MLLKWNSIMKFYNKTYLDTLTENNLEFGIFEDLRGEEFEVFS